MRIAAVLPLLALLSSCGLPRDASGTLEGVQKSGVMRVGVLPNPPWLTDDGVTVGGLEARLVEELATSISARIAWVRGPAFELIRGVKERRLELLAGGFTDDLFWRDEVAFTRPFFTDADKKRHVFAVPPGENAWMVHVERVLDARTR